MPDLGSLIGNVEAFPILERLNFFNHAGVAPCPRVGADAMKRFADELQSTVYVGTQWYADLERLRSSAATLMNATTEEIAFTKNTSEGLCTVARGIDWRPGDRVVTTGIEYPANIYPWMDVARSHGVELVMVPEETDDTGARHVPLAAILRAAEHPRTRMVTLSHVEYASGQRMDLATIGRYCRDNGKLFCVDAIQSLGVLPVDVQGMCIDYLSADGHKWLLGPEGAGVFYVRRELQDQTRPLMIGWMNVVDADNYGNYDFTLKPDARRYESGSWNIVGLLGLKASLEMLLGLGTEAVAARLQVLTSLLAEGLGDKGYQVISPRSGQSWSGIVSFTSATHNHDEIARKLRKSHQTEIVLREGRLRVSPHFYNTEAQMEALLERLPGHGAGSAAI